ncbi:MAG: RNA polymerase sigma factor [Planctomycetes bacterium]|nr:RNA polymerase sigma factor [Planctomycetota bacterium]
MTDLDTRILRHQAELQRLAARILHDAEEAREVVQDAFVALDAAGRGVPEPAVRAWLIRVTTRKALDRRRHHARRPRQLLGQAATELVDPRPVSSGTTAKGPELARAFARLSPRQARVLRARLVEGSSFVAIAEALGISEGATKTHFSRGLRRLRALLDHEGGDDATR